MLDEPNSNLDGEGEQALTQAIASVRSRGGIVVIIAHRPNALAAVDQVLVMAKAKPRRSGPGTRCCARSLRPVEAAVQPAAAGAGVMSMHQEDRSLHAPRAPAGTVVASLLAFGIGGWAATTEIAGAVIAPGSLVVDTNLKKVQHPTGGVVGELRVRDGDHVKAGDVVVRLDDTQTRANLAIITKSLDELAARQARREAERDGTEEFTSFRQSCWRACTTQRWPSVVEGEQKLFEIRRSAREGQVAQLRERIAQLREQIQGPADQVGAKSARSS